jgi:hypothetical protein
MDFRPCLLSVPELERTVRLRTVYAGDDGVMVTIADE